MSETINGKLGFWMSDLPACSKQESPEALPRKTEPVIIGGGYTGLWAAYFYKKYNPDKDVTIIEAKRIGYGASGRNGGWISPLVPGNRSRFAERSSGGKVAAVAMQREFIRSVSDILDTLDREGVEADQAFAGMLSAAHTSAGLNRLHAKRRTDLEYGCQEHEVTALSRDEFRERIEIDDVRGWPVLP